jgi:hypothetical protein
VIDDRFEITLPAGIQLGDVTLRLGMYDAQTKTRLFAEDLATHERYRDDIVPLIQ